MFCFFFFFFFQAEDGIRDLIVTGVQTCALPIWIEPSTATPSATATCRDVLVIADPAPPRSRGTTDITNSVAVGITIPMPAPCRKKMHSSAAIGVIVVSAW